MITEPLFPGYEREIDATSKHHIVWEFDNGYVTAKVVCESGADANCRLYAVSCECEEWHIERDSTGAAFHLATEYDDDTSAEIEVRHAMRAGDECNVATWINEGDIEELHDGPTTFIIGQVDIAPVWHADHYQWSLKSFEVTS